MLNDIRYPIKFEFPFTFKSTYTTERWETNKDNHRKIQDGLACVKQDNTGKFSRYYYGNFNVTGSDRHDESYYFAIKPAEGFFYFDSQRKPKGEIIDIDNLIKRVVESHEYELYPIRSLLNYLKPSFI